MTDLEDRIYAVLKERQLINLATITEDKKPWVRYVTAIGDEDLSLTFATFIKSRKIIHMTRNYEVHVLCGVTSPETARHYLQIQGKAEISTNAEIKAEFWHDDLAHYFTDPDDPNYCVCKVNPYRIEYYAMGSMKPEIWEK